MAISELEERMALISLIDHIMRHLAHSKEILEKGPYVERYPPHDQENSVSYLLFTASFRAEEASQMIESYNHERSSGSWQCSSRKAHRS